MADTTNLAPGDGLPLGREAGVRVLSIDVRWNTGTETALSERIGLAAMPLVRDRVESREHVVHSNQPATPDETTRLGASNGVVEVDLAAAPADVERVVVLAFVHPRANASKRTLDEVSDLSITFRDDASGREIARTDNLARAIGPVTAAAVAEVVRDGDGWRVNVSARGFEAGLDGALQQAGSRL